MFISIASTDHIGDVVGATFGLLGRGLPLYPFDGGDGYGKKSARSAMYVDGSRRSGKLWDLTRERRNERPRQYASHGSRKYRPARLVCHLAHSAQMGTAHVIGLPVPPWVSTHALARN